MTDKENKMNKRLASLLAAALLLPGCSWMTALNPWADDVPAAEETEVAVPQSVNRYLWQAAMQKMSKMPLQRSDLYSGVIVSDWMVVNGVPDEKFQIAVRITCGELRADGLKVTVSKMNRINGKWVQTVPDRRLAGEIERIILNQASVLYRSAVAAGEE